MDESPNTMDALTAQIVPLRVKGFTFEEIAVKTGVNAETVIITWREFIDSRTVMSPDEQAVLQLLRLENLLTKVNERLKYADKAEDYELVIKLLKEVAALQGINKDMKKDAEDKLVQITAAQTALILQAVFALSNAMTVHIGEAFEKHKTIKAIKGELAPATLTTLFNAEAQRVLAQGEES
jgi:hypothetical protein